MSISVINTSVINTSAKPAAKAALPGACPDSCHTGLLPRPTLPQLTRFVRAAPMPLYVKEQIFDAALANEIERLERRKRLEGHPAREDALAQTATGTALTETALALPEALDFPSDPKVREVLENGAFTWLGYTLRGQEEWEYERVSRGGAALTGKEAKRPPRYKVISWGNLGCFCNCPFHAKPGLPDKHVLALTWWLLQTSPKTQRSKTQGSKTQGSKTQMGEEA